MTTVLITGANRGLGLAFARAFSQRGWQVIGTARKPHRAASLAGTGARIEELEVTDGGSVAALAGRLGDAAVDLLLLSAGILAQDDLPDLDPASVLTQLDTNAVGPLRVVQALLPHLGRSAGARIVALSSVMGSIAENRGGGYYGYRSSKAALNAIVRSLAVDLAPMPVVALHPGYVQTRMTGHRGEITAEQAVADLMRVIDRIDAAMSGRFFDRHGEELPW